MNEKKRRKKLTLFRSSSIFLFSSTLLNSFWREKIRWLISFYSTTNNKQTFNENGRNIRMQTKENKKRKKKLTLFDRFAEMVKVSVPNKVLFFSISQFHLEFGSTFKHNRIKTLSFSPNIRATKSLLNTFSSNSSTILTSKSLL